MIVRCDASALVVRSLPVVDAGSDTGKRMIRAQTASVHGKSLDGQWLYVDASAARGWVSGKHVTEVVDTVLPSAAWPKVPHGLEEIKAVFGKPGKPICSAGRIHLPAPLKLSWENSTVKIIACHKLVEDVFTSVFNQLHARGLWTAVENFGGIFQVRAIKGGKKISTHAWGISADIDTLDNALGDRTPEMDPRIIAIFEDHGFYWGGNFSRPDGMHFQRATGY